MRVKRYVVDTMPDALGMIRNELGKDAVILNTKEIRSGGFMGFFGKKRIEVIAAIDGSKRNSDASAAASPATATATAVRKPVMPKHNPYLKQPESSGNDKGGSIRSVPAMPSAVSIMDEEKLLKHAQISPPQPESKQTDDSSTLMQEMQQMKAMIAKLSREVRPDSSTELEGWEAVQTRLEQQEFDSDWIAELHAGYAAHIEETNHESSEQEARNWVHSTLLNFLVQANIKGIDTDTKVVQFVGPTGVGKTTSIAKLAAEQSLKHKKKVGFITSDTYRIAAVEQLKTYATILNAPLEVVFSPQEARKAFEQLQQCDVIFMDTAGRNYRNALFVSELNSLLSAYSPSQTYLVLSLTAKSKDMKAIADNFVKFQIDRVLLTKMDETDTYGSIFNLIRAYPMALSYVANGQNVPDDIINFNPAQIVDKVMGDDNNE